MECCIMIKKFKATLVSSKIKILSFQYFRWNVSGNIKKFENEPLHLNILVEIHLKTVLIITSFNFNINF